MAIDLAAVIAAMLSGLDTVLHEINDRLDGIEARLDDCEALRSIEEKRDA